jgi:hypothetical protein
MAESGSGSGSGSRTNHIDIEDEDDDEDEDEDEYRPSGPTPPSPDVQILRRTKRKRQEPRQFAYDPRNSRYAQRVDADYIRREEEDAMLRRVYERSMQEASKEKIPFDLRTCKDLIHNMFEENKDEEHTECKICFDDSCKLYKFPCDCNFTACIDCYAKWVSTTNKIACVSCRKEHIN